MTLLEALQSLFGRIGLIAFRIDVQIFLIDDFGGLAIVELFLWLFSCDFLNPGKMFFGSSD